MKNKKLTLLALAFVLFSISNIYALDDIGYRKSNQNFTINQVCNDATYITLSTIQYPNGDVENVSTNMTFVGSGAFNYQFSNTSQLGRYDYCGISDGCENTFCSYFELTPSGNSGSSNIAFVILVLVGLWTLNLLGFFNRNPTITALGGIALTFLGLYMVQNGIIIYRDNLTLAISYITLFWGFISTLWVTLEEMDFF